MQNIEFFLLLLLLWWNDDDTLDNDPSAGSPTETLLRLLPGSSHCD